MTSIPQRLAAAAALAVLLTGGGVNVAQARPATDGAAPTVSAPTVFTPGDTTPVDIGGNDLHAGDTIRRNTRLLRFKVTMRGPSDTPITLRAPRGYVHVGLGINNARTLGFAVARGSTYQHRTIKVRVYALKQGQDDGVSGHIYALVKRSSR